MVRALTATSTDTQLGFIWTLVEVPRVRDLYWQFVSHFELIEFSLGILLFENFFINVFFCLYLARVHGELAPCP